jgi:hypothetical protein
MASAFFAIVSQLAPVPDRLRPWLLFASLGGLIFSSLGWICSHFSGIVKFRHCPRGRSSMAILIVALIGASISVILWLLIKPSEAVSVPTKDRPILEPTLVIDSVDANKVRYHFSIKNTGTSAAFAIRISEKTVGMTVTQSKPAPLSQLMPGGTMTHGIPAPAIFDPNEFADQLTIKYRATSADTGIGFQSDYQFWISSDVLKPGEFAYIGANHDDTARDNSTDLIQDFEKQFLQSQGSIYINLPERNDNGTPNAFTLENDQRQFEFDPDARLVKFETKTASGRTVRLVRPLRVSKTGNHIVIFTWNSAGGSLNVDMQRVEDFQR